MPIAKNNNETSKNAKPVSVFFLIFLLLISTGFFALLIFPIAGNWTWLEGWIYLVIFLILYFGNVFILNKKNPEVIRNRMKSKKESISKPAGSDRILLPLLGITMISAFILPSFNHRYEWSQVPIFVKVIGFILVIIGYLLVFKTMQENAYASKVLDIREGQRLIDTGLYAHVRHPMYTGFSIMIIGTPLSLGDWYALIPAIISMVILLIRSVYEEKMLIAGLAGYKEYMQKVKYRLFPYLF